MTGQLWSIVVTVVPAKALHSVDWHLCISLMFCCITPHLFYLLVTKIVLSSHIHICIIDVMSMH